MRAPVFIAVVALGLTTLAGVARRPAVMAQTPTPGPQPDINCRPPPGGRSPERGQLVVTVALDQLAYSLGMPVPMTLTIANPSDEPVTIVTNRLPHFDIEAVATLTRVWGSVPPGSSVPAPTTCRFAPGVAMTMSFAWDQRTGHRYLRGEQVPTGVYRVRGGYFLGPWSRPAFFIVGDATVTPLAAACNAVTVTFPIAARVISVGELTTTAPPYATPPPTPTSPPVLLTSSEAPEALAALVTPHSALEAIWKYDTRAQRFLGWSPLPGAPNDLTSVNRLDPVVVCARAAATLAQPALP